MTDGADVDVAEIRALIARQFENISWTTDRASDWAGFADDFVPDARLFPSARPVTPTSVEAFIDRMKGVAAGDLKSLEESFLGAEIRVFGNVAVAMAVCGVSENRESPERGVEAMLLIKDQGRWRIAAQAWDMEAPGKTVPVALLDCD